MKMRPLGNSGIEASVVAFGAWAIGGWMWGGTEEKESIRAIHVALDAGINFIDTAPVYGFGLSELVVGKALQGVRREQVVLATKCGMVCNTTAGEHKFNSTSFGPDGYGHIGVYVYLHPDSIRKEVESSLKRLGTDRIDLIQTHWQEKTTLIEDTVAGFLDLKKEGKIRAIGACNAGMEQLKQYRAGGGLDVDQEKFSMLDRGIQERGQLNWCSENHVAVLAYSPMARGLLTGKMGSDREFADGDQRKREPRFSVENRRKVQGLMEALKPLAEQHGISISQLVIAWTLHQPGLTHALCGARHPDQAVENARAGGVTLSKEELEGIEKVLEGFRLEE